MSRHRYRYQLLVLETERGFDNLRDAGRAFLNLSPTLKPNGSVRDKDTGQHVTLQAVNEARGREATLEELREWGQEDLYDFAKEGG